MRGNDGLALAYVMVAQQAHRILPRTVPCYSLTISHVQTALAETTCASPITVALRALTVFKAPWLLGTMLSRQIS